MVLSWVKDLQDNYPWEFKGPGWDELCLTRGKFRVSWFKVDSYGSEVIKCI